ncbi:MAG: FAD-dependent oxidoreductase [Magnetococcales bacterium]|nr:FAD-dependent oxidoreductase [Magnetococcales bacterium]
MGQSISTLDTDGAALVDNGLRPATLSVIAMDVDRTIVPNEITPLAGSTLEALVDTLKAGVRVVLLSGTPYGDQVNVKIFSSGSASSYSSEEIQYKLESVSRRCAEPIKEALIKCGQPEAIGNLEVITLSGVEITTYNYDPLKKEYQELTNQKAAANFSPARQLEVGRVMACSYLQVFAKSVLGDEGAFAVVIQSIAVAGNFASIRSLFEDAIKPYSKARFWVFDSEMVILDHENQLDAPRTETIVAHAVEQLKIAGVPLSDEEGYFPRSGDAFIKVTRSEKGMALSDYIVRHAIKGLVVGLGDSLTDDFLWRPLPVPYLPIYLGPAKQVAKYPNILVARHWGRDSLKERFSDIIINRLLTAHISKSSNFFGVELQERSFKVENPAFVASQLADFKGYIFDVDGVLLNGDEVMPGAKKTLEELNKQSIPFVLLTNNSTRSRKDVQEILDRFGLPIQTENIITAPFAASQYLLQKAADAHVLVLGADGLRVELQKAGIKLTQDPEDADYLVTGADPELSIEHLQLGLAALKEGAKWLAVSLDKLHPIPGGYHSGGGAMAGALQAYVDRSPDVYVGKPSLTIMEAALQQLGLEKQQVAMVGDTLASDIAAGIAAGVPACLVLSGATNTTKLAASEIQPDLVISGVGEIGTAIGLKNMPRAPQRANPKTTPQLQDTSHKSDPSQPIRVYVVGDADFEKGLRAVKVTVSANPDEAECLLTGPHIDLDKATLDSCINLLASGARWVVVEDDDLSASTITGGRLLNGALSFCLQREPDLLLNSSSGEPKRSGAGESSIRIYTLGNLILESVSIQKKQAKFAKHTRFVMDMLDDSPGRNAVVVHHNDGDGITSGTILSTALQRAGWQVNAIAVEKLYTQVLEMIFAKFQVPIFFADVGGGAIPEMAKLNSNKTPVVVLDHHHTDAHGDVKESNIYNLCSEPFGISGEEHVCAAGVVWAFARVLNQNNDDLAWMAVVGALADRQDRSFGRLIGLNRIAMEVARQRGDISLRWYEGSRESYTLEVFAKPMAVRALAANLTTTGTVFFHRDGIETSMEAMASRQVAKVANSSFRIARRLQDNLFSEQCRELEKESIVTEHFIVIDSGSRFENMGLKMIGLFLEEINNCRLTGFDPRKYQIGFQNVRSEIKGLGHIGEGWVKVSGRLPPALELEVRSGRMPGFKIIFAKIAEKMNLSLDACHDYAAALVLHRDQKQGFVSLLEEVVQNIIGDTTAIQPLTLISQREQELADLERYGVDILIIGGGITGAGAALDAAARGLKVALVEQNDFGGGTSMTSSKMFHGGLRYLMNLDLNLIFEALRERDTIIRLAPGMVVPLPFLFPIFTDKNEGIFTQLGQSVKVVVEWLRSMLTNKEPPGIVALSRYKVLMSLAMFFYAGLGRLGRLRYWRDRTPKAPRHRILGTDELQEREPSLKKDGLRFGSQYWDGFMACGDSKITMQVIKTANYYGAATVNHAEVVNFLKDENGLVRGAETLDKIAGKRYAIRAKKVINATGPWSEKTTEISGDDTVKLRLTKGVHLLFLRSRLPISSAILIEAVDGRVGWAIPWDQHVLVGTTDDDYQGDPSEVAVEKADVDYLLDSVNSYFPDADLKIADIISTTVGLRPMVAPKIDNTSAGSVSREYSIFKAVDGLISIAGGKFTTYRSMAANLIDTVVKDLVEEFGMNIPSSATEQIPLKKESTPVCLPGLPVDILNHGLNFYGEEFAIMTAWMEEDEKLKERVEEGLPHVWAEIRYAVEHEQAFTLADVMRRRTMLFLKSPDQGVEVAPKIAEFIRNLLGRDETWRDNQVARYKQTVADGKVWNR